MFATYIEGLESCTLFSMACTSLWRSPTLIAQSMLWPAIMLTRLPVTRFTRLIGPGCSLPTQQLSLILFQPAWPKPLRFSHVQLACDGLWDVLPSQRAIEFARQRLREHNDPQQCAQKLVRLGLAGVRVRGGCLLPEQKGVHVETCDA